MSQVPTGIALGDYEPVLLSTIEDKGGKIGVLDVIASREGLSREIYGKTCIHTSNEFNPICVAGQSMTDDEYRRLMENYDIHTNSSRVSKVTGSHILRGSIEGDFRSFVDVFPSMNVNVRDGLDGINKRILEIKRRVKLIDNEIRKYAEGTGVPYDLSKLKIGVVPFFDVQVITVTEDIHSDNIYIDHTFDLLGGVRDRGVKTETHTKENSIGKKYEDLLTILRKKGILDKSIAYQLEVGILPNGSLVLLQVKEFAKKTNPIELGETLPDFANRVMCTLEEGDYTFPIVYGQNSEQGFKNLYSDNREGPKGLILGSNGKDLSIHEYSPDMVAFFHGDAHGGALSHNSFRMAQAVIQKGGVVGFGYAQGYLDNETNFVREVQGNDREIGVSYKNNILDVMLKGGVKKRSIFDMIDQIGKI